MRSNFEKFAIDACESTVQYRVEKLPRYFAIFQGSYRCEPSNTAEATTRVFVLDGE